MRHFLTRILLLVSVNYLETFRLVHYFPWTNLFQFMFPYDSKYWEFIFKGSLKGEIGPAKIAFTVRGWLHLCGRQ